MLFLTTKIVENHDSKLSPIGKQATSNKQQATSNKQHAGHRLRRFYFLSSSS